MIVDYTGLGINNTYSDPRDNGITMRARVAITIGYFPRNFFIFSSFKWVFLVKKMRQN